MGFRCLFCFAKARKATIEQIGTITMINITATASCMGDPFSDSSLEQH